MTPDILVAGGGPAGLAAAIAARLRGFDVLVADPATPPIDKPCGEGLMPDSVAAARALGVDVASAGHAFRGTRFVDVASGASVAADFPRGPGVGLRRTRLHDLLRERASDLGVRMAWGSRADEFTAGWIVGADGGQSAVRRCAGLDGSRRHMRRYGFRRHYRVAPWSDRVEIYWRPAGQLYVTPIADDEVGVAMLGRDPHARLDEALRGVPDIARRLAGAGHGREEGRVTATRRLAAVTRGNVALIGDASGSVDAITGEGLGLAFQHALALADALAAGDLERYEAAHPRLRRRAAWMSGLLLTLDARPLLRRAALATMSACPPIFAGLLAWHVGQAVPGAPRDGIYLSSY
jgi:menaquinone-9 beta-reductase